MSHPKENLKERLVVSAWAICEAGSWQKSNMRSAAQKAPISTTAFYRHFYRHFYWHFTNKNNFKAAVIRRDFQLIYEDMKDSNNDGNFAAYGAHYLRFGLEYPHIYDLMFENTHIDVSLYPHLEPQSNASFNGLVKGVGSGSGFREWVPGVGPGSGSREWVPGVGYRSMAEAKGSIPGYIKGYITGYYSQVRPHQNDARLPPNKAEDIYWKSSKTAAKITSPRHS